MQDTIEALRTAIEHAPRSAPVHPDLRGWWTPEGNFICASCAARILARGCSLPAHSAPVWADSSLARPTGVCVTHPEN